MLSTISFSNPMMPNAIRRATILPALWVFLLEQESQLKPLRGAVLFLRADRHTKSIPRGCVLLFLLCLRNNVDRI